ncbi:MAG: chemotaxis protein CheD [Bdellovibrionales bacterium]|nr:chemotaxis protein CheD [Bdellovibrionales bacterium]
MREQESNIKGVEEIHVKIGEVKIGRKDKILKATLGSCVGIAFYWPERSLSGLAHCLLPAAPQSTTEIGAKFVSQAVPSLIALMKITLEDIPSIQVSVVGGGNMMHQLARPNAQHIGEQNVAYAKAELHKRGFQIRLQETGGEVGRQVCLDGATGEITVRVFTRAA